jgi:hypothetical protein
VSWSGSDEAGGSGVAGFDVYVSADGGAFVPWLTGTTETSAVFHGTAGHGYAFYSVAHDHAGHAEPAPETFDASTRAVAGVVGLHLFYNNSAFDGADPAPGAADDAAIAPDVQPLLPGQTGTFANISSFYLGINGVMIDVAGLPDGSPASLLSAADFAVRAGNGGDPSGWSAGPAPSSVTVRRGAGVGGSDRVTLIWPDRTIRNTWLRLSAAAGSRLGLASPAVFYFGSLPGEAGDVGGPLRVNALDVASVKRALNTASVLAGRVDFNRDGRVNALDVAVVKQNLGHSLTPPAVAAATSVAVRASSPYSSAVVADSSWLAYEIRRMRNDWTAGVPV